MAEMRDLYFNVDVSEALKVLDLSQLIALLNECGYEIERRIACDEK